MKRYLILLIKGIAMGAADVIPGVSGGTIAFLSGIYQELIDSLRSINFNSISLLLKGKFKQFWSEINGNFLLSLFGGILLSIFSLARVMHYLLLEHPIPLWSFFLALIAASSFIILKGEKLYRKGGVVWLLVGFVIALYISLATPAESSEAMWFIFISGVIAICAMILPGISGSFILLLLGKYSYMIGALKEFNIPVILVFGIGASTGLILFSQFLSWLLKRFYRQTIALLVGFMMGSLLKVWPWKILRGSQFSGLDWPASPNQYSAITGQNPQLLSAFIFFVLGLLLVYSVEMVRKKRETK